jgi:hypothetical protein
MIWKIWFVVSLTLLASLCLAGMALAPELMQSEGNAAFAADAIGSAIIIIALWYLAALGWEKQLFSPSFNRVFIVVFAIFLVANILKDGLVAGISMLIFLSPLIVACVRYTQKQHLFAPVENRFWKGFAFFVVFSFALTFLLTFTIYAQNLLNYNAWDICALFTCFYEAAFLIGLAWHKKFLNQMFWKLTSVPWALTSVLSIFFVSEQFKLDNMLRTDLWTYNIFIVIIAALFLWALWRYAFVGEAFSRE